MGSWQKCPARPLSDSPVGYVIRELKKTKKLLKKKRDEQACVQRAREKEE